MQVGTLTVGLSSTMTTIRFLKMKLEYREHIGVVIKRFFAPKKALHVLYHKFSASTLLAGDILEYFYFVFHIFEPSYTTHNNIVPIRISEK